MTAEVDVHGGEVSSPKDVPNGNANADGSVNGNGDDVVSVDPSVDADLSSNSAELDSKLLVVESKQSPIIKEEEVKIEPENEESLVAVNENRGNNVEEKTEPENEESLDVVTGGDVDRENEVENLADQEGCSADQRIDVDQNLEADAALGVQADKDQGQDVIAETFSVNGTVDRDQGVAPQNDSSESAEGVTADLPVETACENDVADKASEIPAADPVRELSADAEQNPVAASCPVADAQLDSQVVSGTGTKEREQVLATGNTQDGDLETAVNGSVYASQEATELNESLEVSESLPSPVDSENVPVEGVQVDASQGTTELKKSLEIAESLSNPVDSENVSVEIVREVSCAPASISHTTTELDEGFAASTVAENCPSCEVDDVKRVTGSGKLERQNSESSDSYPVDNANVIEVESGPIGRDSVSASANNDGRSEIETVVENSLSCEVDDVKRETVNGKFGMQTYPVDNASVIKVESGPIGHDSISASTNNDGRSEIETIVENSLSCEVDDVKRETVNGKFGMQSSESSNSHPVDNPNVIEVDNGPSEDDSVSGYPNKDARSEIGSIKKEEKMRDNSHTKSEVSGVTKCVDDQSIPVDNAVVEFSSSDSVEKESGADVKAESEIENESGVSCRDVPGEDVVLSEQEVPSGSVTGVPDVDDDQPIPVDKESGADVKAESEIENESGVSCRDEPGEDVVLSEREVPSGSVTGVPDVVDDQPIPVDNAVVESSRSDSVEKESGVDVQAESEIENESGVSCRDVPGEDVFVFEREVPSVIDAPDVVDDQPIAVDNAVVESNRSNSVNKESGADVKAESEIENDSGVSSDVPGEDVVSEREVPSGSVAGAPDVVCVQNGGIQSAVVETDDQRYKEVEENEEIQFTDGESDDKTCQEVKDNAAIQFTGEESIDKTCQEVEGIDGIHREETETSTPEGSAVDASEMQNVCPEVVKRPFYFLVKVPRYDDENIREQIKSAQSQVDEKTRSRDAIRDEIQTIRAAYKKYSECLEVTLSEERAARELLKSKRQEIDSLQSTINKVKNAISVEDIDGRIRNMEHMIAHETLPLKEEKQFIRDIKQLKQLREQFSSSMGKQDEVQQAFDQKDQIEERMKLLRKEADSLRDTVLKAEAATQAAKKQQRDESDKLRKLLGQFKAADDTRQEAYKHLQSLKKQAYDKNKHFWKYKDDAKLANDLAFKGDKEVLQHLCFNQVERVLELWNTNDEFRKEYVNSNIRSTLRRLKTLDGRSLGPDEEPPVIRSFVYDRVAKDNSVSDISTIKREKTEQAVPVKPEKVDAKPIPELEEQKNQTTKTKRPAKPSRSVNGSATVSGRDEIEEAIEEEPKRTKEEEELARKAEELARKAEELRKEEEAAKLKEQRRLEEKAKAKEALERKKRTAEKAQARATLRAQKEAEQKEKEREKRAKKKEKRKAATTDDTDIVNEGESPPSSETPLESSQSSEVREKFTTATKRPQKPSQFTKQTAKAKSVPLPLRNRGKRRMQPWMWILIAALVVFALFLLGNSSFSNKFGLEGFGF